MGTNLREARFTIETFPGKVFKGYAERRLLKYHS